MPKDTFFNLSLEKRELIERVAIEEFAEYGYDNGSVNRIIKECSIAKGSFYQYFEDKKDLFKYLMKKSVQEKLKYMSPILQNPMEHDFFTLIRELYLSGLRFAEANPELVKIGNRLLADKENPIHKEIMGENMSNSYEVFEGLLELAISKNEIRGNIDTKFISFIISSLNVAIMEYHKNISNSSNSETQQWDEELMITVNKLLDFIKYGIKAKGGNDND